MAVSVNCVNPHSKSPTVRGLYWGLLIHGNSGISHGQDSMHIAYWALNADSM